jgi:glutathione S-transferase
LLVRSSKLGAEIGKCWSNDVLRWWETETVMIDLYGYKYSVYAWIARFTLHEKGINYNWIEVNPFSDNVDAGYLRKHPFGRVPTLVHGNFVLYETGAITRYTDEAFEGPKLQPDDLKERARANQVMSIVDSYTYWPLVRQVFAHGVMGPRVGRPFDSEEVVRGLKASERTLDALEELIGDNRFFAGSSLSLADIHLAPMLSYFSEADASESAINRRVRLKRWFLEICRRKAFLETKPMLPNPTVR